MRTPQRIRWPLRALAFAGAFGWVGLAALSARQPDPSAPQATGVVYHDRDGDGLRDPDESGLPGVGVSNGRDVVRTDAEGRYRLPLTDDTVIFVIKPAGWMTPLDEDNAPRFYYVHKPAGSPRLTYPGVAPTGPLPDSVDFPLVRNHEPERFRVILFGDTQPDSQQDIHYLAHDIIEELVGVDAAFGISLGDLVNNDLSLLEPLIETIGVLGLPWHYVLGNHDKNQDSLDDRYSSETFQRFFGPPHYAFDYGQVHFVVLDDVVWEKPEPDKRRSYHAGLGRKQLEFIRNDLALVPAEKLIVLAMHIPLIEVEDRAELFRILQERPYTLSLSAHYHFQAHMFLDSDDGWNAPNPHHHLIHATACGSWWTGAPDELGIPHTIMRDGAPNGYSFITFDRNRYDIVFKAARRPADYQMNIYAPEEVAQSQTAQCEVLVNVFAGSDRSTVEMRLGDRGHWITMKRTERLDPSYAQLQAMESKLESPPWEKLPRRTRDCHHLWHGQLPADPPIGTHLVRVRTTDMFGHTYTASRVIRITRDGPESAP
ncbi:MAG: calcineurin-like phosphoesterase family protein [Phycisphaerales bacterium]|nr:MAG: calcineurin-like phosphoesterase family protein [Phycisphaerales bacterium]